MADINWIKLRIDMFDDEKIKIIQSMPEGDAILVIWIRLIALAGKCNANGFVLVEDEFPYSDEMLSVIFNKPLTVVRLALSTFEKFRMVESTQKGIYITNFEKHQNIEGMDKIREQNRIRKQRERERKHALLIAETSSEVPELPEFETPSGESEKEECHENSDTVTQMSRDSHDVTTREVTQQRENKNKSKNIYNISSYEDIVETPEPEVQTTEPSERLSYDKIMNSYNSICADLPEIRAMSDKRKRSVKSLLNEFDKLKILPGITPYERLEILFKATQASDFLSGRSGKWNGCSFDWLMNKTNALKVLEGNYTNKGGVTGGRNNQGHNEQNVPRPDEATNGALERFRRNNGSGL